MDNKMSRYSSCTAKIRKLLSWTFLTGVRERHVGKGGSNSYVYWNYALTVFPASVIDPYDWQNPVQFQYVNLWGIYLWIELGRIFSDSDEYSDDISLDQSMCLLREDVIAAAIFWVKGVHLKRLWWMAFQLLCNIHFVCVPTFVWPHTHTHTHQQLIYKFTLCVFLHFLAPLRSSLLKSLCGPSALWPLSSLPVFPFHSFSSFFILFYPSDGTQIQLREHFKKTKGTQPQSDIEPTVKDTRPRIQRGDSKDTQTHINPAPHFTHEPHPTVPSPRLYVCLTLHPA
jgi:hypothetical protein